jgi:hypothetical protein
MTIQNRAFAAGQGASCTAEGTCLTAETPNGNGSLEAKAA